MLNDDLEYGYETYIYIENEKQEELLTQRWVLHYQDKMTLDAFKDSLMNKTKATIVEEKDVVQILSELKDVFG